MSYASEVAADSPIAYWRLGTGSTDVNDSAGSHTLTKTGSPAEVAGLIPSDGNTCRDFVGDATTRYDYSGGSLGDFDFTGTASFSIEAWVNLDAIDTNFRRIVGHENATDGWMLEVHSTAGFSINRGGGGVFQTQSEDVVSAATGSTFHVVGTYNGSQLNLYVNGALAGGPKTATETFAAVTNSVRTGPFTGTNYVDGRIDEIAVYNTALSSTRILAHYNAALAASLPQARVGFVYGYKQKTLSGTLI